MTQYFSEVLQALTGEKLLDSLSMDQVQEMKHKFCYMAQNWKDEE